MNQLECDRDRARWCHLSTIPGTTPHCLVNTDGNVNLLGTRSLAFTDLTRLGNTLILHYLCQVKQVDTRQDTRLTSLPFPRIKVLAKKHVVGVDIDSRLDRGTPCLLQG